MEQMRELIEACVGVTGFFLWDLASSLRVDTVTTATLYSAFFLVFGGGLAVTGPAIGLPSTPAAEALTTPAHIIPDDSTIHS